MTTTQPLHRPCARVGRRVDVRLFNVEVTIEDELGVTVWIDGHDEPIYIPRTTDDGRPTYQVEIVDAIRAGHAYRARRGGELLLATLADGQVWLVDQEHKVWRTANAIDAYGDLECIAGPAAPQHTALDGDLDGELDAYDRQGRTPAPARSPAERIADVAAIAPQYVRLVERQPERPATLADADTAVMPAVPADPDGPAR